MKNTLKNILDKSGKKTEISFKNKEKRSSFDESFGKNKMEIASTFIGGDENSIALSKKLATY
jgi:hypothetical protein